MSSGLGSPARESLPAPRPAERSGWPRQRPHPGWTGHPAWKGSEPQHLGLHRAWGPSVTLGLRNLQISRLQVMKPTNKRKRDFSEKEPEPGAKATQHTPQLSSSSPHTPARQPVFSQRSDHSQWTSSSYTCPQQDVVEGFLSHLFLRRLNIP